jgi:cellulose synthase/poly-beta-1,6-N-acetylglucosamine synthase-like glycosyltransferase
MTMDVAQAAAPWRGGQQIRVRQSGREPSVTVVIPAKNEARNLPCVFAGLENLDVEVILIDGNST